MLLADASAYLTDPGEIQQFDTLRLKIETARRAEQSQQAAYLHQSSLSDQARKPVGERQVIRTV